MTRDGKIYGMKNHDCHVYMQRLIPLEFFDVFPKPIWGPLIVLSLFFKELCATELFVSNMENAKVLMFETMYKL